MGRITVGPSHFEEKILNSVNPVNIVVPIIEQPNFDEHIIQEPKVVVKEVIKEVFIDRPIEVIKYQEVEKIVVEEKIVEIVKEVLVKQPVEVFQEKIVKKFVPFIPIGIKCLIVVQTIVIIVLYFK